MPKKVEIPKTKLRRDVVKTIVATHAHGSLSLQQGRFVTDKEIEEKRLALANYKFA